MIRTTLTAAVAVAALASKGGERMRRHRKARPTTVAVVLCGLLVALASAAGAGLAQSAGPPAESPAAESIRETERTKLRALVDADVAVLERIYADDYQLIPPLGFALSKEDFLGAVAAGAVDFLSYDVISPIEVRLYGQAAAIRFQARADVVAAGLGHFSHDAWHTLLYEKRNGHWQAVWEQTTGIGGFPPPS